VKEALKHISGFPDQQDVFKDLLELKDLLEERDALAARIASIQPVLWRGDFVALGGISKNCRVGHVLDLMVRATDQIATVVWYGTDTATSTTEKVSLNLLRRVSMHEGFATVGGFVLETPRPA